MVSPCTASAVASLRTMNHPTARMSRFRGWLLPFPGGLKLFGAYDGFGFLPRKMHQPVYNKIPFCRYLTVVRRSTQGHLNGIRNLKHYGF